MREMGADRQRIRVKQDINTLRNAARHIQDFAGNASLGNVSLCRECFSHLLVFWILCMSPRISLFASALISLKKSNNKLIKRN